MRVRWCPRRRGARCRRVILLHRDRVRTCRSAAARSEPGQERRLIQKSGDIVGGGGIYPHAAAEVPVLVLGTERLMRHVPDQRII